MAAVKSLQMGADFGRKYGDLLTQYLVAGFSAKQVGNTYNVISDGLEQVMILAILIVGALLVMQNDGFAGRMSQPLLRLVGLWQEFLQANIVVKRLGDILDMPQESHTLTMTRENQRGGKNRIAISGLPLRRASTRHLATNELRNTFCAVPQETVLFAGTLCDNPVMAHPHASFGGGILACTAAEIHEVIETLNDGYQTEIGERGTGLSGGQHQRVAIARALLKRPKILILDEAVSNLDLQTAEHYARTINKLKGKVTMLFITHQIPRGGRWMG